MKILRFILLSPPFRSPYREAADDSTSFNYTLFLNKVNGFLHIYNIKCIFIHSQPFYQATLSRKGFEKIHFQHIQHIAVSSYIYML